MSRANKTKRINKNIDQQATRQELVTGDEHLLFSQPASLYNFANVPIREYSLFISAFQESTDVVSKLMFELSSVKPMDTINVLINSDGGLINEGKAIINSLDQTGAKIVTTLSSRGYSMGSLIFCIGHQRIVYEHSAIMFHNYSAGSYGKGHEIKDHVEFMDSSLKSFFRAYSIGLTDEEIQQMFEGKEFWFNAKDMCERGIATHVSIDGELIPAEDYLKLLKKTVKVGKKGKVRITSILEGLKYNIDFLSDYLDQKDEERNAIRSQIYALAEQL